MYGTLQPTGPSMLVLELHCLMLNLPVGTLDLHFGVLVSLTQGGGCLLKANEHFLSMPCKCCCDASFFTIGGPPTSKILHEGSIIICWEMWYNIVAGKLFHCCLPLQLYSSLWSTLCAMCGGLFQAPFLLASLLHWHVLLEGYYAPHSD